MCYWTSTDGRIMWGPLIRLNMCDTLVVGLKEKQVKDHLDRVLMVRCTNLH